MAALDATLTDGACSPSWAAATEPAAASAPAPYEGALGDPDRYQVVRLLGAGGMGVVFEARDLALDRAVALKVVRSADGAAVAARLRHQARAMARVSHPNVAALFDVGAVGERVYLAMELVRGGTLRGRGGAGRPWRELVGLLEQAGRGLAAAHAAGVIHHDVKPDNVLVGDDDVRLTDFGLACIDGAPALAVAAADGDRVSGRRPGAVAGHARVHGARAAGGRGDGALGSVRVLRDGVRAARGLPAVRGEGGRRGVPRRSGSRAARARRGRGQTRPTCRRASARSLDRGMRPDPAERYRICRRCSRRSPSGKGAPRRRARRAGHGGGGAAGGARQRGEAPRPRGRIRSKLLRALIRSKLLRAHGPQFGALIRSKLLPASQAPGFRGRWVRMRSGGEPARAAERREARPRGEHRAAPAAPGGAGMARRLGPRGTRAQAAGPERGARRRARRRAGARPAAAPRRRRRGTTCHPRGPATPPRSQIRARGAAGAHEAAPVVARGGDHAERARPRRHLARRQLRRRGYRRSRPRTRATRARSGASRPRWRAAPRRGRAAAAASRERPRACAGSPRAGAPSSTSSSGSRSAAAAAAARRRPDRARTRGRSPSRPRRWPRSSRRAGSTRRGSRAHRTGARAGAPRSPTRAARSAARAPRPRGRARDLGSPVMAHAAPRSR